MALATSTVTPLIVQTAPNGKVPDQIMVINPDGSISYEPNLRYSQPTIIRRTYRKRALPKYRYILEQVRRLLVMTSQIIVFFNIRFRKLNRIDAVNGASTGALDDARVLIFAIESSLARCSVCSFWASSCFCCSEPS